jgi:hypothetical protein
MSYQQYDLTREDIERLITKYELKPVLKSQNPYIASGPDYEILAGLKPNGLYDIQMLDKKQVEKSVENTIRVFRDYAKAAKS